MALKRLTIHRKNGYEQYYDFDDEKERFSVIGPCLVVFGGKYSSDVIYQGVVSLEDIWSISDLSSDEELINRIGDLSEEDLGKVRNFCESAGLIK